MANYHFRATAFDLGVIAETATAVYADGLTAYSDFWYVFSALDK